MKQLSKHELNRLTVKELKEKIPFHIMADGEVFAIVLPAKEVSEPQFPKRKGKLSELPLSKKRQAENRLPKNF
jgi:hypothetical protein